MASRHRRRDHDPPAPYVGDVARRAAGTPAPVNAKAPIAIPTAKSPSPSRPRTKCGMTGSTAPTPSSDKQRDGEDAGERRPLGPARRCVGRHLARPSVARSSARLILPLAVFGSSSANSTIRGNL